MIIQKQSLAIRQQEYKLTVDHRIDHLSSHARPTMRFSFLISVKFSENFEEYMHYATYLFSWPTK